jgi:putative membrane protein
VHLARYLVVSWALNALVLGVVTALFTDVSTDNFGDLLVAAAVFGVLNTILKPLMRLITAPLAVLTLGLAWFGVSMLMLWLTSVLVSGFHIHGFWTYVWATVTVWAVNCVLDAIAYFWRGGGRHAAAAAT